MNPILRRCWVCRCRSNISSITENNYNVKLLLRVWRSQSFQIHISNIILVYVCTLSAYLFLSFVSDIIFLFTLFCCCWLTFRVDLDVLGWCCCDAGDLVLAKIPPLEPGDLFGVDVWIMLTTDVFLPVQPRMKLSY